MSSKKRSSSSAKSTKKQNSHAKKVTGYLKRIFLSSQGLPIFLSLSVLGVLFVLFRMKSLEVDYATIDINKQIEKVVLENKELKAQKARSLSVEKLRQMAKKYDLAQPDQKQIIVIQ